ncbi:MULTISPECIES: amino acid ABC transporter permease [Chelatococcus]|uniref:General L-amino acid transport system permease protein n=1 Tax=Chelatococcus caeni TaxID=1348468 RepID=A0A840BTB4_9HYPH|nr:MULTISPECIES: amino acid ABC transporter permease [Chelatococcus]ALA19344.1 amino acid ABC transporter permease [Chelatococcus sp. CO-6]MBB4016681.1 general L-amino acid transport system permease protein [Chelatococcus caeni]
MAITTEPVAYVRGTPIAEQPPPLLARGWVAWVRENLFSSVGNTILTLIALYIIYLVVPPAIRFFFLDAVWTGSDREACLAANVGREVGACWAYVDAKFSYFVYGSYPWDERWRVDIVFVLGAIGIAWLLWLDAPKRNLGALYFFVIFPVVAFILLRGWTAVGLERVDTSLWGGILVTLVVSIVGIVVSLPLGVLLALGRRSRLPLVRLASVIFIEVVRGVPLITVLFMANTMLPLFLPGNMSPDRLLRPLVGVALFASAYMAEVVRGGLQAIPKGQYEGAMSLGLGYWRMMRLIILPQALRIVIPGIVNTFIGLFKDTTLVSIVGIFDLIKTVEVTLVDPTWATPVTRLTGYAFAGLFYFICCYGMSRYSLAVERRLAAGQKR